MPPPAYEVVPLPDPDLAEWKGESLAGKTLLIWPSEGYGDMIMWARYLPVLQRQGVDFVVAANVRLVRLFERIGCRVHILGTKRPLPAVDVWTHFNLLPHFLGWRPVAEAVYLDFPHTSGGGIGVVPTGFSRYHNDANRSLFGEDAERLLALGRDLRPEATGAFDFSDTADIIAGLDLVVSVDTSVANLAGSMGKACWVLLPAVKTSYRWGSPGQNWYPAVKQYRQEDDGTWGPVLDRIEADLAAMGAPVGSGS